MEQEEMKIQDRDLDVQFSIRDLTCLLMACAHTFREMMEGKLDDNPGFRTLSEENKEAMMEQIGELRPRIVQMIFDAIGPEESARATAMVEQQMMVNHGTRPN